MSYLEIFQRPSFRDQQKNEINKEMTKHIVKKEKVKDEQKLLEYDYIEPKIEEYIRNKNKTKNNYDYPVNLFKKIFFTWTRKVLKAANNNKQLEFSHLGIFSKELYPDYFLKEIKTQWGEMSKKTKSSPLIKALLKGNIKSLLLIFLGSLVVAILDSFNIIFYNQIVNNLDYNPDDQPKYHLLTSMLLLLINYFIYIMTFRSMENYTKIFSFKIITQLNALIYDKLLRISPYSNISEGFLVNFIQSGLENFGEFFTYSAAILILPAQILFFIHLLFTLLGKTFSFSIICLGLFFLVFMQLESIRTKYRKEILSKKDRRIKTTKQAFDMIKIIKLYSWEDYFLDKIRREREEELMYFKKIQVISLFIDALTWSIGPILNFISIILYNLFNDPLELSKLLTSLYIFHNLTDPLFLIPEYANGLKESLLSIKKLESFLYSKEYTPSQMINKIRNKNIIQKKEKAEKNDEKEIENVPVEALDNLSISKEESDKSNINIEKEKEIMIDIDDINFGIIKKEEEFMNIDDDEKINNTKIKEESDIDVELEVIDEEKGKTNKKEKLLNQYKKEQNISLKKNKKEIVKGTVIIPLLKGIKLTIQQGKLVGIIGEIGSGKSCLFNAILNNLDILNGQNKRIIINGTLAYVPQKAWILNDTIRNNIIFNKPYIEEKYKRIVEICQLKHDFELLKQKDLTILNEDGNSLSSGQKTKLNIARAIYSDADIYLLDDPFSALDANISKKIFEKVIKEYLKGKTILIITRALQYIPMMDYIIKMKEGEIQFYGDSKESKNQIINKDLFSSNQTEIFQETINKHHKKQKQKKLGIESESDYTDSEQFLITMKSSGKNMASSKKMKNTFHETTQIEILKIVFSYSGGWPIFFVILIFNILWKFSESESDFIITDWSTTESGKENKFFFYYLLAKLISIIFIFVKSYLIVNALITFNRNIHESLIYRLLRGPINLFHDIVEKSHIINRISKDIENSVQYFWTLNSTLSILSLIINSIIISSFLFWKVIFIVPALIFMDFFIYNYYIKCAKGLDLLEKYAREPILSGIKETFSGITSIRAYGFKDTFQSLYHQKLHNFYKVLVYQIGCSSWLAINIDIISFCFLFLISIFIWYFRNKISGASLGILLNYILKLTEHSYNFFNNFNKNRKMSSSMESCDAYTHIVQEAPLKLKNDEMLIQNNFPKSGKIEFVNYSVRYRPDTKMILKDINIIIQPGEKIGIVGRTGSGKSTLCLCLFRILEASTGQILIDDIDISLIGLSLLRSTITYIPQEPTLIDGTLRENLDPLGNYDDESMIEALKSLDMDYILEEDGLNFMVKENGDKFSSGEKQLICMARAIIRKNKIIIMDEATSCLDYNSEQLIQKAILTTLKDSTIITVAHRIKTILEYDRILVFEQGKLTEQGSPKELIEKKEGNFFKLYSQSLV